jgi:hypothetical protein
MFVVSQVQRFTDEGHVHFHSVTVSHRESMHSTDICIDTDQQAKPFFVKHAHVTWSIEGSSLIE